jgi:ribosomal-protein-alanine N-acetyltransferase
MVKIEDVFGDLPTLETDRLILRPLRAEDVGDVFAFTSDPEVACYARWSAHTSIDDTRRFVQRDLDLYRRGEVAPWGWCSNERARWSGPVGSTGGR